MHSGANDIPPWLASLSDRTLRRLNSRLAYLLRMVDTELQYREMRSPTLVTTRPIEQAADH